MRKVKNKLLKYLGFIFLLFFLSSCSTLKTIPQKKPIYLSWQQRLTKLTALKQWSSYGAFSIRCNDHTEIANYTWQQKNTNYNINIASPLNLISFYITGNDKEVTLWKSTTEKYTNTSPEKLLLEQTSWSLPISNLVYWIKGQPIPKQFYKIRFDNYHHPIQLKQQNWIINYANYITIDHIDLPTKIFLQNKQFKIKIIVHTWQIKI
jgi:outer membrane lipoprotein LolB